ncbi:hypothetical protein Q7Q91_03175 [Lactiplantibacillus pentosus]|uniref:hypothetical protein n=1 Tax=Lactiplantibacillus pentosus TaxID=1589 RepID=UPI0026F4E3AA|nr:hypothetical protein [Lactiplantibacillus pentosus]MDO7803988.1 hypothetical protein [Lactiplantibacillus pentosus]
MTTTTALTTQAEQALDQSYAKFKREQLTLDKSQLFENADQIFAMKEIEAATRQYLFDDEIAKQVIKLDAQVLPTMYQKGQEGEFLKLNFTGNDIRWLLGLPRTHHRQRGSK